MKDKQQSQQENALASTLCKGTTEDGSPCRAHRTIESGEYCMRHGPLAAEYEERRLAGSRRKLDLVAELTSESQNLRTSADCVLFLEKCLNAVLCGALKKEQVTMIGQLMAYVGQHIKAAGDELARMRNSNKLIINQTRRVTLSFQTESDLDYFLQAGDPNVQVKILEEMQDMKQLTQYQDEEPEPEDEEPTDVEPEEEEPDAFGNIELEPHNWEKLIHKQPGGFALIENKCRKCGNVSKTAHRRTECYGNEYTA